MHMFDNFRSKTIDVGDGVEIFARVGGSGPPLLLLHGYPETHVCWHTVVPHLLSTFTVVVTDLRGYGASSKLEGGPHHANYAKRAMALDQVKVMHALGFDRFVLGTCRNVALRMREVDARAQPTDMAELDVISFRPEPEPMAVGALVRCIRELDKREQSVVHLSFTEGQAAEVIAAALETTAGNVRVLRHRAVAQLRRCMDNCKEVAR